MFCQNLPRFAKNKRYKKETPFSEIERLYSQLKQTTKNNNKMDSSGKVAFVTGANGISGHAIIEHLIRTPESEWLVKQFPTPSFSLITA